jgi:hypothetical protein
MECSICNEDYNETDCKPYCLNPCGHSFCLKCINLLVNKACPICRKRIQSTIPNFAMVEMLHNWTPRPRQNFLSDINYMKASIHASLNKKQLELRKHINLIREKISVDTENKLNRLINDNAELVSQLDEISSYGESRLIDLNQQAESELEVFEQNFSSFTLNDLSQNSQRLVEIISKKIKDLDEFNLDEFKIELELRKRSDGNQIGKIGRVLICEEDVNQNDEIRSDSTTANTNSANFLPLNKNLKYKRCKIYLANDSEGEYGFTMSSRVKPESMIYSVDLDSNAYKANLRANDVIVEINKINICHFKHEQILQMLKDSKKEKQIELLVIQKEYYLLYYEAQYGR